MIDKTFPADATPRFEVKIQSGDVRVLPGAEGELRVVADAHPDSGLEAVKRGGTVVVSTAKTGWFRSDSADVTVYAPEATEAVISTASADVRVKTPLARLEVNTASGDIAFDTVADLVVRTASGDVRGDQVTESAQVVGASGDVRIKSCAGKGTFSSASGDVEIDRCQGGSMKASTASGDVAVAMCNSNDVDCKSMSGSVSLGLPPRTRVNLDATTMSGSVNVPQPSDSKLEPESSMSIKIRLVSGDVNLYRSTQV